MNSSALRAAATQPKIGRSANRPNRTSAPTASTPGPKVSTSRGPIGPPELSTETISSSGATERSWNSRMEKLLRPATLWSRPLSASVGRAIAVEDSDPAAPSTTADAGGWPRR